MRKGIKVPNVTFKVRAEDENGAFGWTDLTTDDMFNLSGIGYDRRVAVFSLPGAFTPTCSEKQLPAYEENYEKLRSFVDEVYCISVNDSFVMNAWAKNQGIKNVKMIPDGNGSFTKQMGMLISKDHLGFSERLTSVLEVNIEKQMNIIDKNYTFIATVGSTAPFIGLFGTVWGIMNSFQSIAISRNTSLAIVAPGIAEALFATALGLLAAIPAVVAFNKFSSDSKKYSQKLESFSKRFISIV